MDKSQNKSYKGQAITFLEKVIKVRRHLVRKNIYPTYQTLQTLDRVDAQFQYSRNAFSDETAARFITRHQEAIRSLIPGRNSGSNKALIAELDSLLTEGNTKIQQP